MFGGVEGAAEDLGVDAGGVELVLRDRPPDGAGAEGARGEVEFGFAEDLAGDDTSAEEGDDLVGDFDGAVAQPALAPRDFDVRLQDGDRRGVAGDRRVGRVGLLDQGHRVLQVQGAHQVCAALVEVDRALVDGRVGGGLVDRAQEAAGAVLDDLDRAAAPAADVGEVGGAFAAGPVPGLRPAAEQLRGLQLRQQVRRRRAEEVQVLIGEREFGRRRAQVGAKT